MYRELNQLQVGRNLKKFTYFAKTMAIVKMNLHENLKIFPPESNH